jgi:hypothetical protein
VAFTYLLSTEIGEVRLGLADTGGVAPGSVATSGYAFEDAEITYFLSKAGSVDGAIGLGAKTLLADAARRTRSFSLPGVTYNDGARVQALKDVIAMYGAEMPTVAVRMPAPTAFDSGFTDPTPTLTSSGS